MVTLNIQFRSKICRRVQTMLHGPLLGSNSLHGPSWVQTALHGPLLGSNSVVWTIAGFKQCCITSWDIEGRERP